MSFEIELLVLAHPGLASRHIEPGVMEPLRVERLPA
jgi:hypothetical protein